MKSNIGLPSSTVRSLAAVISLIMVFGITLGLTVPLIAIVLDGQGHSSVAIGLHASTQFLGIMLTSPITPRLLLAVGTSRLMVLSMAVMTLILCSFPFFTGFIPWLLLRLLLGGIEGVIFISAETWINQVAPTARRGRAIGVYGTLLAGGIAAGPLLLELTGVEGALPFLISAVFTVISLLILLLALNVVPRIHKTSRRSPWEIAKTVPIAVTSAMLFGFLDAAAFGLLPIYGLALKVDDGSVRQWGITSKGATTWRDIPGPIYGYYGSTDADGFLDKFGFIIGDLCQPKYFYSKRLHLDADVSRHIKFYWQ